MAKGPVRPEERTRVRELHTAGYSRNAIARDLGRGVATVTRIADDLGLSFDRTATAEATAARVEDNRAKRAQLAADLLDDAQRLRARLWQPSTQVIAGREGAERVELDLPPPRDSRDLVQAVTGAVRAHTDLDRHDTDTGAEGARSMLVNLQAQITDMWAADQTGDERPADVEQHQDDEEHQDDTA